MCAKSLELCPTLCDLMDCSPPGSSVYGILQARILEWVTISSSKGSTFPEAPALHGGFFTTEPLGKPKIPSLPAIPEPQRWTSVVGLNTAKNLDLGSGNCLYLLRLPGSWLRWQSPGTNQGFWSQIDVGSNRLGSMSSHVTLSSLSPLRGHYLN